MEYFQIHIDEIGVDGSQFSFGMATDWRMQQAIQHDLKNRK